MPRRPRRLNRRYQRRRFNRNRFIKKYNRLARTTPLRYRRLSIPRKLPIGGFPARRTTVLRYVEDFTLNPGVATSAVNVFSINNLYDPNFTGTGHQPMFFDNYAALYSKYRVNHATITFVALQNKVVNTTTPNLSNGTNIGNNFFYNANERACRMFILADQDPSDYPANLDNLIEEGNPRMKWKYCFQNTEARAQKLTMKQYPHRVCNLARGDDSLRATTSGGPGIPAYFICGVDSMPSTNSDAMRYQVIITYNVTFFDFIANQTQN